MDVIEKSNLNRQFLFREKDLKKPKSTCAAAAANAINPACKIEALQDAVGAATEAVFNDAFWDGLNVVVNALDQPALDPLGLTRAQFQQDPDQTTPQALPQTAPGQADRFNTRKLTRQDQTGLNWRHRFDGQGALTEGHFSLYQGRRSVTQWQAIPVSTQFNAANPALTERQPGGVIDFDRSYSGADARLNWRWPLPAER
jgi:hypothetical protein